MTCEPLAGWRHVAVTERRTMEDFAHQMRWLADAAYPEAEKMVDPRDRLEFHTCVFSPFGQRSGVHSRKRGTSLAFAVTQMMIRLLGRIEVAQKSSIPPDH